MTKLPFNSVNKSPIQTTVEIVEELLPQAVLDQQELDRKERTYKNIEEKTDIEMMNERSK